MRYHVNVYSRGQLVNATSYATEPEAIAAMNRDNAQDKAANQRNAHNHAMRLRDMALGDGPDTITPIVCAPLYDYTREIEPCDGIRCGCCYEAGHNRGVTNWV